MMAWHQQHIHICTAILHISKSLYKKEAGREASTIMCAPHIFALAGQPTGGLQFSLNKPPPTIRMQHGAARRLAPPAFPTIICLSCSNSRLVAKTSHRARCTHPPHATATSAHCYFFVSCAHNTALTLLHLPHKTRRTTHRHHHHCHTHLHSPHAATFYRTFRAFSLSLL